MSEPDVSAKYHNQGQMLANRVLKRLKHLSKRFKKQNIDVFRLYDWDIPEIRAVVDWYAGHIVLAEYTRRQSTPEWLPLMGAAVAEKLGIPAKNVHLKERKAGKKDGVRYKRIATTDQKFIVSERDLKFYVNLNDYVDTGLFSDHRNTRQMIRETVAGKDLLNLYCYTGAFTCSAAKGDARSTLSVDRSDTAITWAQENMRLNELHSNHHTFVKADAYTFLKRTAQRKRTFDLAIVDPPSYSTTRITNAAFDIAQDHPQLLTAVVPVMRKGGTIFFSTNHQNFKMRWKPPDMARITEITAHTIPEDYVNKRKTIHRCWKIAV